MTFSPRSFSLPVAFAVAALTLAACGGDDNTTNATTTPATTTETSAATSTNATSTTAASSGGETLKLSADPNGALKFDKSKLTAKAGKVTIVMDNPSSSGIPHAVAVEGNGVDKDGEIVQPGSKSTVSVDVKPGTYKFYCPVPGHEAAGMKGTLTVN
jgi:uncharacterized cupredoxin-like copper-binding protein